MPALGDWEQLERLFQQSLSLYRALGDRYMTAQVLGFMGTLAEARKRLSSGAGDDGRRAWRCGGRSAMHSG